MNFGKQGLSIAATAAVSAAVKVSRKRIFSILKFFLFFNYIVNVNVSVFPLRQLRFSL